MERSAQVYMRDRLAGRLDQTSSGYRFQYDTTYLAREDARPISLSLPLRAEAYESPSLMPFFEGLLAEGWLDDLTRRTLHLDPNDRFGYLLRVGARTVGAVTVRPTTEGEAS